MSRRLLLSLALALAAKGALAVTADRSLIVDRSALHAPDLTLYQANETTVDFTLRTDPRHVFSVSNLTPVVCWYRTNDATIVTAAVQVVSATSGLIRATWRPADIPTPVSQAIWQIGFVEGPKTFAQGTLTILADRYAAGAAATNFSSTINCSLYTWINPPWLQPTNMYWAGLLGNPSSSTSLVSFVASNTVTSLGGATGAISIGSGLTLSNGTLYGTGGVTSGQVVSITAPLYLPIGGTAAVASVALGGWPTQFRASAVTNAPWLTAASLTDGTVSSAALGYGAYSGTDGVAIGYGAGANGSRNIAIGGSSGYYGLAVVPMEFADTVELGIGTAVSNGWLHFRGYPVVNASGHIPASIIDDLPTSGTFNHAALSNVTGNGVLHISSAEQSRIALALTNGALYATAAQGARADMALTNAAAFDAAGSAAAVSNALAAGAAAGATALQPAGSGASLTGITASQVGADATGSAAAVSNALAPRVAASLTNLTVTATTNSAGVASYADGTLRIGTNVPAAAASGVTTINGISNAVTLAVAGASALETNGSTLTISNQVPAAPAGSFPLYLGADTNGSIAWYNQYSQIWLPLGTNYTTYTYNGVVQYWTNSFGISNVEARIWGAAGGGSVLGGTSGAGGSGGLTYGITSVTNNEVLWLYVGKGGLSQNATASFYGGGRSYTIGNNQGGGGGASAVRRANGTWLLVAGGGGGAGNSVGGSGGGSSGGSGGGTAYGYGGTQSAGGNAGATNGLAGSAFQGGDSLTNCSAGGGGFYGGGAAGNTSSSAGGGSGLAAVIGSVTYRGSGATPPGTDDPYYISGKGAGAVNSNGNDGQITLRGW